MRHQIVNVLFRYLCPTVRRFLARIYVIYRVGEDYNMSVIFKIMFVITFYLIYIFLLGGAYLQDVGDLRNVNEFRIKKILIMLFRI